MTRIIRIGIAGLLGAVIVHVVVILLFPAFGSNDVWDAMAYGDEGRFAVLPQPEPGVVDRAYLDPAMVHAVCRFEGLDQHPLRVMADLSGTFWSAAVFDRGGRNLFSVNDRSAGAPPLDLLLVGPADLSALQQNAAAVLEDAVVVDLAVGSGLVVLRAFVGDSTMLPRVQAMLAAANCNAAIDLAPLPAADAPEPLSAVPAELPPEALPVP